MKTPASSIHPHRALIRPRAPQLDCEVTKEILATARIADSSHCMSAAAVLAARPNAFKISVDLQTIRFSDRIRRLRFIYLTPRLVQQAIVLWDQGQKVEPFSFRLTGGHVTTMFKNRKLLAGIKTTEDGPQPTTVLATKKRDNTPANLARQGLRMHTGHTPTRVGGRAPPVDIPFSRRRAFGLRALVR